VRIAYAVPCHCSLGVIWCCSMPLFFFNFLPMYLSFYKILQAFGSSETCYSILLLKVSATHEDLCFRVFLKAASSIELLGNELIQAANNFCNCWLAYTWVEVQLNGGQTSRL
jgi:hypothetical protein